jgi:DNA mismatch repair protein MutS2
MVFTIEPGGHTPFHRHSFEHLNYVIEGTGAVVAEDGREHAIAWSLAQDLSSYSAHLLDLISFLEYAKDSALVLVDEILGSTDPEEGSALAVSILKELKRRNCITIVTTHLSRLKAVAENESGFKNASFEFDPENLTPTYHLRIGLPGPSYGIATAKKLGLSQELVDGAENMLDPESKKVIELVSQLDRKQTELDQRLRKLVQEETDAQARSKELDEKRPGASGKGAGAEKRASQTA